MRFLPFLILFLILQSCSPVRDFSISFNVVSHRGDFKVQILDRADNIQINYSFRDSIKRSMLTDSVYMRQFDSLNAGSAFTKPITDTLNALRAEYSVYTTDSLLLKKEYYPSFMRALKGVISSSNEELINAAGKRKRVMLDGRSYHITIVTKDSTRTLDIHQPDKKLRPLIYDLVNQPINIHKSIRNNNFMDRMRELGP